MIEIGGMVFVGLEVLGIGVFLVAVGLALVVHGGLLIKKFLRKGTAR